MFNDVIYRCGVGLDTTRPRPSPRGSPETQVTARVEVLNEGRQMCPQSSAYSGIEVERLRMLDGGCGIITSVYLTAVRLPPDMCNIKEPIKASLSPRLRSQG